MLFRNVLYLLLGLTCCIESAWSADPPKSAPVSITDKLNKKITTTTARRALTSHIATIARSIDAEIIFLREDLQAERITTTQTVALTNEMDVPAGEVLRKLLKVANPAGQLIYVFRPSDREGAADTIVITTRTAATARKEKIPAEFDEQPK